MIIFRLLFSGLIIFELLNFFGILNFKLDFTWLGLVVTAVFIWIIIELLNFWFKKKTKKPLPLWILVLAVLFIYLDALADIMQLYSKYIWFDQFLHYTGGIALAASLFYVFLELEKAKLFKMGTLGISVLAVCTSVMLGVFYEWEEYFEDMINGSNRLGDGKDTANDLMLCLFGGITVFTAINLYYKYKKK